MCTQLALDSVIRQKEFLYQLREILVSHTSMFSSDQLL